MSVSKEVAQHRLSAAEALSKSLVTRQNDSKKRLQELETRLASARRVETSSIESLKVLTTHHQMLLDELDTCATAFLQLTVPTSLSKEARQEHEKRLQAVMKS